MKMTRSAFTLVEILVVLLVIGILTALAIPAVLHSKMSANDASAKQTLRTLASACEWYSNTKGVYPTSEALLLSASPPYLNSGYCGQTVNGFVYACSMDSGGYTITATPSTIGTTGTTTLTVSTGGLITP